MNFFTKARCVEEWSLCKVYLDKQSTDHVECAKEKGSMKEPLQRSGFNTVAIRDLLPAAHEKIDSSITYESPPLICNMQRVLCPEAGWCYHCGWWASLGGPRIGKTLPCRKEWGGAWSMWVNCVCVKRTDALYVNKRKKRTKFALCQMLLVDLEFCAYIYLAVCKKKKIIIISGVYILPKNNNTKLLTPSK